MAEVTGSFGNEHIELNNAATEATLKQLLAATIAMAKASGKDSKFQQSLEKELAKLAKQAQDQGKLNADAIKQAKEKAKQEEENLKRLKDAKAADEASKKAKAEYNTKLKAAASAVADVGKELIGLATGAAKLTGVLAGMEDSISKANAALSSIPLVGGFLSSMLGPAADAAEKVYGTFSKLSSVGANMTGNFSVMLNAASGAGLTLEQFQGVVQQNAQGLALFGGTTADGARRMAEVGKQIKQSGLGNELLRMGYTTEQINSGMASYIGTMSRTGALQGMSTQQIAKASANYMKELDGLARLTGQSREEKQKEMDELARDAQLNAAISHLSRTEQEEARQLIASYPKQHQAAIKDMIATGNISTDAAIKFNAMMPQAAAKFMQVGRTLEAGGKISKEGMMATRDAYIDEAKVARDRNKGLVRYSRDFDNEFAGIVEAANSQKGAMKKAAGEQNNLAGEGQSAAEQLGKFKQDIAKQGNAFTDALQNAFVKSGGMAAMQKALSAMSQFAMDYVVPALTKMFQGINVLVDVFTGPTMTAVTGFALALAPLAGAIVVAVVAIKGLMAAGAAVGGVFASVGGIISGAVAGLGAMLSGAAAAVAAFAWPITLAVGAIVAIYLAMQHFNVDLTQLWHIVKDKVIDAFTSVVDFLEDIFVPVFDVVTDVINDVVMPAFTAVGDFLKGMFMSALDGVSSAFNFLNTNVIQPLTPAFNTLTEAVKKITGFFSDMAGKFLHFIRGFDSLGSVTTFMSQMFKEFGLFVKGMSLSLRDKLSWLPGITAPSMEEKQALEDEKKALAEEKREADAAREKVAQRRDAEAALKQQERDKAREDRDKARDAERKKRDADYIKEKANKDKKALDDKTAAEKKAAEDKKAAEENATVDYSNPIAMLKSFGKQQNSKIYQEAKIADERKKAAEELKASEDALRQAGEKVAKAKTDDERKLALEEMEVAKKRLSDAVEADKKAKNLKAEGTVAQPQQQAAPPAASTPGASAAGTPAAAPTATGSTVRLNQDVQQNLEMVKAAMIKRGMTDPKYINATLANVMKETGGKVVEENLNYKNTSNDRIRSIFGSRATGKTDKELDEIKKDPTKMGEMMYGKDTKIGQQMGNTEPGDGFKYRGRGNIQLTGKSNYAAASKAIYGDNRLVDNPDLVNDPAVAAEVTAWYMEKGQARMAKTLGLDTKNLSQADANLLATSQVAGRAIKRGATDYTSTELLGKVDKYASDAKLAGIAGAPVSPSAAQAVASTGTRPTTTAAAPTTTTPARPTAAPMNPLDALSNLVTLGIQPATLAFQDLIAKGITPLTNTIMASGIKVNTPLGTTPNTTPSVTPTDDKLSTLASFRSKTSAVTPMGPQAIEAAAKEQQRLAAETAEKAEKARTASAQNDPRRLDKPPVQVAPAQETAESLLAQLNTKMDQLIKATNRTVDLNDKQLSVQKSLSGNLYA